MTASDLAKLSSDVNWPYEQNKKKIACVRKKGEDCGLVGGRYIFKIRIMGGGGSNFYMNIFWAGSVLKQHFLKNHRPPGT